MLELLLLSESVATVRNYYYFHEMCILEKIAIFKPRCSVIIGRNCYCSEELLLVSESLSSVTQLLQVNGTVTSVRNCY